MSKVVCGACARPKSNLKHNIFCPTNIKETCKSLGCNEEIAIRVLKRDLLYGTMIPDFKKNATGE